MNLVLLVIIVEMIIMIIANLWTVANRNQEYQQIPRSLKN